PSGRPPTRRWYGWQTLITDGAALFATPFVPTAGLGIYLGGAPVVHLTHGRFGTAAVSLGLRVGAPVAGFLTGAALRGFSSDCGFDGRCGYDTAVFGVLGGALGVVAAVTVDAAVLAREEVPVEKPKSTALRPHASPRREGGFDVGLAGTW
ncbi:MAG TPA: hypothetical protein VM925_18985, partial [Labilithrix sp.]|nr:hypothetical protein [Labilithrix sp.]